MEKKKASPAGIIIVIACIVLLVVVFFGVKISKKNKKSGFPWGAGAGGETVVSVKTVEAKKTVLHDYVNTNGEIEPQSSIDVFPSIGGKIVDVKVSLGSHVNKGDLIAEVDPSQPGSQYAHSPVYAPISGTITTTPKKIGTTVSASTVITNIGDVENLQISANIPERYVAALKPGLKAIVVLEAYPDVKFTATVSRVSPVLDKASRTKNVILNFDSNDSRINAGMFAKVKLYTQDYTGLAAIPSTAILERGTTKYVYVVKEDNTVVSKEVLVGNSVEELIQITGVEFGDRVVTEGMTILADGSKVMDITNGIPVEEPVAEIKMDADAQDDKTPADKAVKKEKKAKKAKAEK